MLIAALLTGFPVAFVLAGVSLLVALIGNLFGAFDLAFLHAFAPRLYGIMMNPLLLAVPLFIFMGVMLERSKIAEELLTTMSGLFGQLRGGLGISVMVVGALLAASTGIVGATVVTMGLISLPVMLKKNYCEKLSCGAICASGTLGQIIPPSIVLILLGDQISSSHQTAQMKLGNLAPEPVSLADIFMGALIPGFGLVILYIFWLMIYGKWHPERVPKLSEQEVDTIHHTTFIDALKVLLPPLLLIIIVLGSILAGFATATESAAVGALGAMVLAFCKGALTLENLRYVTLETTKNSTMIFAILIGAAMFTLVFRGFGGDDIVHELLHDLPGGLLLAMLLVMLTMFLLGFFLDFIEIIYVVVPIVAPVLLMMDANPVWLAIMIAVNLQTSFLTPPFGFSLFYLRGVAPKHIETAKIYKGVLPFIAIQLLMLAILALFPEVSIWLPETVYNKNF